MIVVNTPYQAWHLINYLKGNEDIKSQTGIFYSDGEAEKADIKNALIINPCLLSEPHGYDEIIFYDTPFNEKIFRRQTDCFRSLKRHIFFEKSIIISPTKINKTFKTLTILTPFLYLAKSTIPIIIKIKDVTIIIKKLINPCRNTINPP